MQHRSRRSTPKDFTIPTCPAWTTFDLIPIHWVRKQLVDTCTSPVTKTKQFHYNIELRMAWSLDIRKQHAINERVQLHYLIKNMFLNKKRVFLTSVNVTCFWTFDVRPYNCSSHIAACSMLDSSYKLLTYSHQSLHKDMNRYSNFLINW